MFFVLYGDEVAPEYSCDYSPESYMDYVTYFNFTGDGGTYVIDTCSDYTAFDTVLNVLEVTGEGECSDTCVASNDDFCRTSSRVEVATEAGKTYMLVVSGYDMSFGDFAVKMFPFSATWTCDRGAPNDGICDCGCGDHDPDCNVTTNQVIDRCKEKNFVECCEMDGSGVYLGTCTEECLKNAPCQFDRNGMPPDCEVCPRVCSPHFGEMCGVERDHCKNGMQDWDETGFDCGGSECRPCPGPPPTCTDGTQNGAETGVDCGGPFCIPCECGAGNAPTCQMGPGPCADCCNMDYATFTGTSACCGNGRRDFYENGTVDGGPDCFPSCFDGYKNGDEVCVDQGGSCGAHACPAPTCFDGMRNGDEMETDCGGSCPNPCPPPMHQCANGVRDGDEPAVDCGRSCKVSCDPNWVCNLNQLAPEDSDDTCKDESIDIAGGVGEMMVPENPSYNCYAPDTFCVKTFQDPGASNMYVWFNYISLQDFYEYVVIFDEDYNVIWEFDQTDPLWDVWGIPVIEVPGDTVIVAFESDSGLNKCGFRLITCSDVGTNMCGRRDICSGHGVSMSPTGVSNSCICDPYYSGPTCAEVSCMEATGCQECLAVGTDDGGDRECGWCPESRECRKKNDGCPEMIPPTDVCPCTEFSSCGDCTLNEKCGWCFDIDKVRQECMAGTEWKPHESNCVDWLFDPAVTECPELCEDDCNGQGSCVCTSSGCTCQCYYSFTGETCAEGILNTWASRYSFDPESIDFTKETLTSPVLDAGLTATPYLFFGERRILLFGELVLSGDAFGDGVPMGPPLPPPGGTARRLLQTGGDRKPPYFLYAFAENAHRQGSAFDFPDGRVGHSAVLAPNPDSEEAADVPYVILLFGGVTTLEDDSEVQHNDVWAFAPPDGWWKICEGRNCPESSLPVPTSHHSAVLLDEATGSAVNGKMFLFGGDNYGFTTNQLLTFEVNSSTFGSIDVPDTVSGRRGHTAVLVNGVMFVMGGEVCAAGKCAATDEVLAYDIDANTWTTVESSGSFTARAYHSATYTGDSIYVFGGETFANRTVGDDSGNGTTYLSDMHAFHVPTRTWHEIVYNSFSPAIIPNARSRHSAFFLTGDGQRDLAVAGGRNAGGALGDMFVYHLGPLVFDVTPTTLSPLGGQNVTLTGSFLGDLSGSACAFLDANNIDRSSATVHSSYAEGEILVHSDAEVVCSVPPRLPPADGSEGNVTVVIAQRSLVKLSAGRVDRTFWGANNLTVSILPCPSGTEQNTGWTWVPDTPPAVACSSCNPGYFSPNGEDYTCTICPAGSIAAEAGSSECTLCPAGTVQPDPGQAECDPCDKGTFVGTAGSIVCEECGLPPQAGGRYTYQANPGSVACEECPEFSKSYPRASNRTACRCEPNNYGEDGETCTPCDLEKMVCPGDGSKWPQAAPGFWRSDPNSADMMECSPKDVCVDNGQCKEGHEGRLCSECADGFYEASGYCKKCPEGGNTWKIVCALLAGTFTVAGLLYAAQPNIPPEDGEDEERDGINEGVNKNNSSSNAATTLMISFLQVLTSFKGFRIPWPASILGLFEFFSFININVELVSPECSIKIGFYEKWKHQMLLPFYVFLLYCVFAAVFLLYKLIKDRREPWSVKKRMLILTWYVFWAGYLLFAIMAYLYLTSTTLSFFACTEQPDGTTTLNVEPSLLCHDDAWKAHQGLAWFGVFFYVMAIPLGMTAMLLWLRKPWQEKPANVERTVLGNFFVKRYEPEYFYWEITVMLRKLGVSLVIMFLAAKPLLQAVSALVVLFIALFSVVYTRPFVRPLYDFLEIYLLLTNLTVLFAGILFTNEESLDKGVTDATVVFIQILIWTAVALILFVTGLEWKDWLKGVYQDYFGGEDPVVAYKEKGNGAEMDELHETLLLRRADRLKKDLADLAQEDQAFVLAQMIKDQEAQAAQDAADDAERVVDARRRIKEAEADGEEADDRDVAIVAAADAKKREGDDEGMSTASNSKEESSSSDGPSPSKSKDGSRTSLIPPLPSQMPPPPGAAGGADASAEKASSEVSLPNTVNEDTPMLDDKQRTLANADTTRSMASLVDAPDLK